LGLVSGNPERSESRILDAFFSHTLGNFLSHIFLRSNPYFYVVYLDVGAEALQFMDAKSLEEFDAAEANCQDPPTRIWNVANYFSKYGVEPDIMVLDSFHAKNEKMKTAFSDFIQSFIRRKNDVPEYQDVPVSVSGGRSVRNIETTSGGRSYAPIAQ